MARINVDTELWNDPRFEKLRDKLGSKATAIGTLVILWEIGQQYWRKKKQLIPKNIFDLFEFKSEILQSGFAIEKGDGIYCHGAEERWEYLHTPSELGKLSARARVQKYGSAVPFNASNQAQKPNGRSESFGERPEPSSSSSSSSSKRSKTYCTTDVVQELDFLSIYEKYPRKLGKKRGLELCKKLVKTPEAFERLKKAVENYTLLTKSDKTEERFVKHFSSFVRVWEDYAEIVPRARPTLRGSNV